MTTGSCHCGAVRYEMGASVVRFTYCHCHDCRKIHDALPQFAEWPVTTPMRGADRPPG